MLNVLHIVYNPTAGKGRARSLIGSVVAFLEANRVAYRLLTTERVGHAAELAAAAPAGSVVVAAGGDGTVHEVVRGVLNGAAGERSQGRCLGVLPLGSGDDFAFSLGLARTDLAGALKRLLDPRRALVDVGFVDGEPFVNSVGTGFDAEAAHRVRTSPVFLKGVFAYLYAVVASLPRFGNVPVTVEVDGERVFAGAALLVTLQNGPRSGGSFVFAPAAVNDDGLLDVMVAEEVGLLEAGLILPRVMRAEHVGHEKVRLFRGRRVSLEWGRPQRGHADGEPLAARQRFVAHVEPGALAVLR